ncbi:hypothetical protein FRZ61_02010 [Hypericibacter adhaerens]|uniref:Uncharacterized protein n=1 Tax=Hypericibacter adhaerens TaxID=2602016 RepID=A0A5J6MSE0_9PROT|nr:hypothetical protein FRZ61_02010 [Hypericibacter adhaerens]
MGVRGYVECCRNIDNSAAMNHKPAPGSKPGRGVFKGTKRFSRSACYTFLHLPLEGEAGVGVVTYSMSATFTRPDMLAALRSTITPHPNLPLKGGGD